EFRCQSRAQSPQQLFARKRIIVGTWLRTVHRTTVPPQRRSDRTNAGAASSLLPPKLFAGSGNFPSRLGGMRTRTLRRSVMLHRFPQQVLVHRPENFVSEFESSYLGSA